MAAININNIMDGIGDRLATISGLRVSRYVPDSISPPFAIVAMPELVSYDVTHGRGQDMAEFPVHVLVGRVSERSSAVALGAYMAGTGSSSIKTTIEGDTTLGGNSSSVRVTEGAVSIIAIAGVEYLAATFTVEVYS